MVSDIKKLRLNVSVPQNYVPAVKLDTKVQITVPEYPGKTYDGVVEASSRAVDAASGTTRMQVVVDNCGRRADAGRLRQYAHRAAATLQVLSAFRRAR